MPLYVCVYINSVYQNRVLIKRRSLLCESGWLRNLPNYQMRESFPLRELCCCCCCYCYLVVSKSLKDLDRLVSIWRTTAVLLSKCVCARCSLVVPLLVFWSFFYSFLCFDFLPLRVYLLIFLCLSSSSICPSSIWDDEAAGDCP